MINFGFGLDLDVIGPEHLETLREARNSYKIRKWCRQQDLISYPDQEKWFERINSDQTVKMYLIRKEEKAAGVCGLTSIDWINRRAEFSLYIFPQCHGSGFGKQALQTLLSHGFRNLGLHLIWGESFDGNRAMDTFDALGFRREGVRRDFYFRDGKFIDAHLFSITAEEWQKQCSQQAS